MPRKASSRAPAESAESHTEIPSSATPQWDSSPTTLPGFMADLKTWFPKNHQNNRSMIEHNLFLNSKKQMVVISAMAFRCPHAAAPPRATPLSLNAAR